MRVCLVYDCLFPHTVGGAERWYRNLAERLAAEGHEVTYLTLRQWERGERAQIDARVRVVTAGPRMALYTQDGRRRILPPLVFGLGVLAHLLRHGRRYDVVHTCAFPYFSLLAAALVRPLARLRRWSSTGSRSGAAPTGATTSAAWAGASASSCSGCARAYPSARSASPSCTPQRLREEGLRGEVTVLRGLYAGDAERRRAARGRARWCCSPARLIPEKQAPLAVAAIALAAQRIDGPARRVPRRRPRARGAATRRSPSTGCRRDRRARRASPTPETVDAEMRSALCMLLPSRREGYGMVVVEAAARGDAERRRRRRGQRRHRADRGGRQRRRRRERGRRRRSPRRSCACTRPGSRCARAPRAWFAENAERLSLESSLRKVLDSYAADDRSAGRVGDRRRREPASARVARERRGAPCAPR